MGNEFVKVFEIVWERVLLFSEEVVWNKGEVMVTVEVEFEVVELL